VFRFFPHFVYVKIKIFTRRAVCRVYRSVCVFGCLCWWVGGWVVFGGSLVGDMCMGVCLFLGYLFRPFFLFFVLFWQQRDFIIIQHDHCRRLRNVKNNCMNIYVCSCERFPFAVFCANIF